MHLHGYFEDILTTGPAMQEIECITHITRIQRLFSNRRVQLSKCFDEFLDVAAAGQKPVRDVWLNNGIADSCIAAAK